MQIIEPNQNDTMTETKLKSLDESSCKGIYGLQNKVKPDKWNIGQCGQAKGIKRRWNDYKRLDCRFQSKLNRALLKYGYDGFNKVVLERCPPELTDKNEIKSWLNDREIYWIKFYNSVENGYNCHSGGGSHYNSEESKRKLSLAKRGRPHSEEHKRKLSISAKNRTDVRVCSDETREKLRKANTGRVFNDGWRKKLSIARMGRTATDEVRKKISGAKKGISLSSAHKEKIRKFMSGPNNPFLGKHHSDETKRKISAASSGRKASAAVLEKMRIIGKINRPIGKFRHTDQSKAKLSIAHTGKKLSEEHKRKLGDAARGSVRTEATKLNISNSLKGKLYPHRKKKISIFSPVGKFIETVLGFNETVKKYNIGPNNLTISLNTGRAIMSGKNKGLIFRKSE